MKNTSNKVIKVYDFVSEEIWKGDYKIDFKDFVSGKEI